MNRFLLSLAFILFSFFISAKAAPRAASAYSPAPASMPNGAGRLSIVATPPFFATAPSVNAGAPSLITNMTATLNGTINDNGANTTVTVLYGTDPGLVGAATTTVSSPTINAGSGNTPITANLSGLSVATIYYYQISATNSIGTTSSTINSFNTPAVITNVDVPPSGTYVLGNQLVFTVHFYPNAAAIQVNTTGGVPYIPVTVGAGTGKAVFDHVDPTYQNVAYFIYTVAAGDYAPAGISLGSSIVFNGGTVQDAAGTSTLLTVNGVSSTSGVLVDAASPVVNSVNRQNPLAAAVNAGTSVTYQVTFSKAVTGVDISDFTATGTATAAGAISTVAAVSSSVYNVTVGPLTGMGTLRLDVNNSGTGIADVLASLPLSGGFTSGETYTVSSATVVVLPVSIPAATVGVAYSANFTASGGTAPYSYAVTAGSLPLGLTLNSTTGALTGTPTAGGSFPITVTATDAGSFSGNDVTTLTVNAPTITLSPTTLPDGTYGAAYSQTLLATGGTAPYTYSVSSGALPAGVTLSASTGVLSGTATTAGTYNFTVQATDVSTGTGAPYSGSQLYTLVIDKAALTITADNQSSTYGGALPTLTASYSGFVNGDNAASLTTAPTLTTTATAASAVGGYPITASGAVSGNYSISYAAGTLTIGQAPLAITADNQTAAYGGAIPALTVSYSGLVNGDNAASLTTAPTVTTTGTSASPAGSYPITVSGAVDNNYTITYVAGTLTIGKTVLTITADNQSSTYGGAIPALTVSYSGFVNGDNAASLTTAPTLSTTATSASPAGTYPITASGAVDNNYTIAYVAGTLTIGQAALTITADNQSSTYGSAIPALTVSYSGFVNGDNAASLTTAPTLSTTATSASSAGTYPITASGAVDNNYTIAYVAGTLTIGQAALTITGDNQSSTYGSAIPALTASYSGFVNGDNAASLTTAPTITTTGTSASPAGMYPITASGAVSGNYAITYLGGTLIIGQAALTITADNQTAAYGGAIPALTVSYNGFVNGDNAASLTTAPTLSTTATAASPAGTYPITVSGAVDNNYTITYAAGTLTIGKTVLTITADNQNSTYGGAIPALTVSYSGFVNGDNAASLTTQPTINSTGTSASAAGSYPITASGAVDNNYAITYVDGTLTIGQASLTITANDQSATYGGAIPTLTVSYSGLVNGDNATSLTTQPTITSTGTSASPAGAYPITVGGAVSGNYNITYVSGTLTIGKASLTIIANDQNSTYGSAIPALTVSYSGFVNGDNAASLTTTPTIITTARSASPVGTYPITASGAVSGNYAITYAGGTLTIGKAVLTVTANSQTRYYNQPNPVLTYVYSGFVNGDDASVLNSAPTITTSAQQNSPVGQYPITLSGGTAANYTLLYQDGVLTIIQSLTNTITFEPLPVKTYGDPDFVITATALSGLPVRFVSGDNAIATVTQNSSGDWVVHIVSTGQVTISAFQDGNAAYAPATEVDQSLQINKKEQSITFAALPATATTADAPLALLASASSGLPVTFTVSDPTLATISGGKVTFTGTGMVTITATQAGDDDYGAAAPVSYTIQVFNGAAYQSHIGVFPNPAHGTLYIRFSQDYLITKYILFDINGQVVKGVNIVTASSSVLPVDVSDLAPGYYLLRVVCIRSGSISFPVFKVLIQ